MIDGFESISQDDRRLNLALPSCFEPATRLTRSHIRWSLAMLAVAILAAFVVFMGILNIIDFGRID